MTEPLNRNSPSKTKSVPAPVEFWERIDEWRIAQKPPMTVAGAIRALAEEALAAKGYAPKKSR